MSWGEGGMTIRDHTRPVEIVSVASFDRLQTSPHLTTFSTSTLLLFATFLSLFS
ncbi:hypothetical protein BJX70DRAFT_365031 [Aspergillus crustosus]